MSWDVSDNRRLRSHGGNLAAVLYRLEREDLSRYERICRQIGRVLPGFDRFDIEEDYGKVLLRWRAKWSDKSFGAHLTSDGSLRFFALVTLLNLPPAMLPFVVTLDEPELGLHPAAIALLGGLIKSLSVERQVIVATQSPLLVDAFDLDEVFVLDLKDRAHDLSQAGRRGLPTLARRRLQLGRALADECTWWEAVIRVGIAVEGETEERFVKDVLADHLLRFGVFPSPRPLRGDINAAKLVSVMANLYWDF